MSCGTRTQYFRPGDPDGVPFLRSSLGINYSSRGYCGVLVLLYCVLLVMRTAQWPVTAPLFRQPAPSPVLRLLWLGTPLPNVPVRASAADAFTGVLLTDFAAGYCVLRSRVRICHRRGPLTAAPDHCGPPGPTVSPVAVLQNSGFETPPPHRPANYTCVHCCPAVRLCQALLFLWATRETITTPPPNVYSSRHRFSRA